MLPDRISILAVSSDDDDHSSMRAILRHSNWTLFTANTIGETFRLLEDHDLPVMVCERNLLDGSWKDLMKIMAFNERAPRLIVASSLADECLWSEVLNLGGYDVLLKPLNPSELFRVASGAARSWREQNRATNETLLAGATVA
jgi:DNA-binding response OmpR family regulator